jgi:hypothetical protein
VTFRRRALGSAVVAGGLAALALPVLAHEANPASRRTCSPGHPALLALSRRRAGTGSYRDGARVAPEYRPRAGARHSPWVRLVPAAGVAQYPRCLVAAGVVDRTSRRRPAPEQTLPVDARTYWWPGSAVTTAVRLGSACSRILQPYREMQSGTL